MRYVYTEKLILTEEEVEILDQARILLDNIYLTAQKNSEIKALACAAVNNICGLLSDKQSDLE